MPKLTVFILSAIFYFLMSCNAYAVTWSDVAVSARARISQLKSQGYIVRSEVVDLGSGSFVFNIYKTAPHTITLLGVVQIPITKSNNDLRVGYFADYYANGEVHAKLSLFSDGTNTFVAGQPGTYVENQPSFTSPTYAVNLQSALSSYFIPASTWAYIETIKLRYSNASWVTNRYVYGTDFSGVKAYLSENEYNFLAELEELDSSYNYQVPSDCDGFHPESSGSSMAAEVNGETITLTDTVYRVPCDKVHCMEAPGWHQDTPQIPEGCETDTFTADGIRYTTTTCREGNRVTYTDTGSDGSSYTVCYYQYYWDPAADGLPSGTGSGVPSGVTTTTRGANPGEGDNTGGAGGGDGQVFPNLSSTPKRPPMGNYTSHTYTPPFNSISTASTKASEDIYKAKDETYRASVIADIKTTINESFPLNVLPHVSSYFSGLNGTFSTPVKPTSVVTFTIAGHSVGTIDPLSEMCDLLEPIRPAIRGFIYALSTLYFLFAVVDVVRKR